MKEQVLTTKQMQYLKELGVDTSTASMYRWEDDHGERVVSNGDAPWVDKTEPVFTLQDLIDMLPPKLYYNEGSNHISTSQEGLSDIATLTMSKYRTGYMVGYKQHSKEGAIVLFKKETILEAIFLLVWWAAEEGLLNK